MRLRLPSQRYFEDGASAELAPRNFGILMHKAFSQAVTVADIYDAVRQMTRDALISEPEAERLKAEIDKALSDPTVSSWFGEGWSEVRNENDIIVPKSSSTRRPDRVMTKGDRAEIKTRMSELTRQRNEKQPVQYPSAGSFFKRPAGHFAGKLVEDAGLKGISVGGAQVSSKHAGFVINAGGATPQDIVDLMHLVQNTVYDRTGVMLEPEVRIIDDKYGRN